MASNLYYWFKSNYDFAERVDFAYWWNFSGEGSLINVAALFSFKHIPPHL